MAPPPPNWHTPSGEAMDPDVHAEQRPVESQAVQFAGGSPDASTTQQWPPAHARDWQAPAEAHELPAQPGSAVQRPCEGRPRSEGKEGEITTDEASLRGLMGRPKTRESHNPIK